MASSMALIFFVLFSSLVSTVLSQPPLPIIDSLPPYGTNFNQGVSTGYKNPYGGDEIYGELVGKNSIGGNIYKYNWSVSWQIAYPDCVGRRIVAVNGLLPGPTVRIATDDSVNIYVYNNMPSEGITMHWHGIRQLGSPWEDGAAFINQCPIGPAEVYNYKFAVPEQQGTFWYHTHLGVQKSAGALGLFIVDPIDPPPFQVDQDLPFLVSDWLHMDESYTAGYIAFVANSMLINGKGYFDCYSKTDIGGSLDPYVDCEPNNSKCGNVTMRVKAGRKYLLRVINTGSGEYALIQFQNHSLTVVMADGGYTKRLSVDQLPVATGQTYGVILTTNQPIAAYWIYVGTVFSLTPICGFATHSKECPKAIGTLFYMKSTTVQYKGDPPQNSPYPQYYEQLQPITDFDNSIKMHKNYIEPLPKITRTIKLGQAAGWDGYIPIYDLNRIQGIFPRTPVLHSKYFGTKLEVSTKAYDTYDPADPTTFSIIGDKGSKGAPVYDIKRDDGVLIVFQNSLINTTSYPDPMPTSDPNFNYTGLYASVLVTSISHSWHLHGHDFWVLGSGLGLYNDTTDFPKLNFKNPIKRNVTPQVPLGWSVILWKADNPGAWIMHCHFDSHLAAGMFVVFMVDEKNIPPPPNDTILCGAAVNYNLPGVTKKDPKGFGNKKMLRL